MSEETPKNIEIQLNEDIAQGIYSNLSIINHTDFEFVVDFVYLQPNVSKGKVQSRVILTPQNAKRFLLALQDNVSKYETKHGKISREHLGHSKDVSIK